MQDVSKMNFNTMSKSDILKFFKNVVGQRGEMLEFFSGSIRDDEDTVMMAVESDGLSLKFASDRLKADRNIVLAAINDGASSIEYAHDSLKDCKDFAIAAINENCNSFQYMSSKLKDDYDVALAAVSEEIHNIRYVSDNLKKNRDIVLAALCSCDDSPEIYCEETKESLQYCCNVFKDDKEMALAAVRQAPHSLRILPESMQSDKDVILAAIYKCVDDLNHLENRIWKNRNETFILACLTSYIDALNFASGRLQKINV